MRPPGEGPPDRGNGLYTLRVQPLSDRVTDRKRRPNDHEEAAPNVGESQGQDEGSRRGHNRRREQEGRRTSQTEGRCGRRGSGAEGEDPPRAGQSQGSGEERDKQEGKDKGLLGNVGDTLSGR